MAELYNRYFKLVESNGSNLKDVPIEMRDKDMCVAALNAKYGGSFMAVQHIPNELLKDRLFLQSFIKACAWGIEYIPASYVDEDLCSFAVKNNPSSLGYLPEKYCTEKIFLMALECHTTNIRKTFHIMYLQHRNSLTKKIYKKAILIDPHLKKFLPKKFVNGKPIFTTSVPIIVK